MSASAPRPAVESNDGRADSAGAPMYVGVQTAAAPSASVKAQTEEAGTQTPITFMNEKPHDFIAAFLAHAVASGASAAQLADTICVTCNDLDTALAPIIGKRGVAALYRRSLHLASRVHSGLAAAHAGPPLVMDIDVLRAALAQQSAGDTAASGLLVLKTFHELLVALIGAPLAERLLQSVWARYWR